MSENNVIFDPESHVYTVGGKSMPSVTKIIQIAKPVDFSHVSEDVLERARVFGNSVHEASALWDRGELDIFDLDPALAKPLDAWVRFKDQYKFIPTIIEEPMYSKKYGFVGTPDRIGTIGKDKVQVDIKTGQDSWSIDLQTAGYDILSPVKRRLIVFIPTDGNIKVRECSDRTDKTVFLSCLNIFNYRQRKENKL